MKNFKFSRNSLKRLEGVDERVLNIVKEAIKITKIDFGIPEYGGWRSPEQQHKLYLDEKSNCDGLYKKSKHQSGKAVDVYAYVDGKASWDIEYMSQIACAFLQAAIKLGYDIQWGGLWINFIDTPHFEIIED
tara:strand:- start:1708 stop:2103 length:396 start_codon:yes stop_codon:yes gene_type:complete